ncbi:hypothetical protein PPL_03126 [Heterostelium album PN500]|uniref:Uncharacterized protein n=1 Tax=Heterostelium pallidum (strain ATCC 26659 / Pp 5 / PN500) TaxID=670386 RepID=D3B405_HETP5|nr:hypothetical protein PPL_03126 [Heterostelium album PN500]EFA84053.1 hypothetical protein PPL_03126 [Heterostelium album PN500]|eukprot:XP_020436170.1 hypothetical protein PPL_03126 [Heterostelium album PN500]
MTSTEEKPPNFDNMSADEKRLYEKYGRLPKQSQLLAKKDKKFFDSADWAKGQHEAKEQQKQPSEKPISE